MMKKVINRSRKGECVLGAFAVSSILIEEVRREGRDEEELRGVHFSNEQGTSFTI